MSNDGGTSVFQTLVTQGAISNPVFSIYLAESGSEIFFGGINQALYKGSFTYMPVTEQVVIQDDAFRFSVNNGIAGLLARQN